MTTLRPYQKECLEAIRSNYAAGVSRQLVVLPTGVGKAHIAAHLPDAIGMRRNQMLFLVHRNELADQAVRQFRKANPHRSVTLDRAHHKPDLNADIIVASTATLGQLNEGDPELFSERIRAYNPERVRYVQHDESHTLANSETHIQVLRYFKLYKSEPENCDPSKLLVGWTATPNRPDGIGLDTIFDKVVYQRDMREMIDAGWLAPLAAYRIETQVDINDVKSSHGDFQIADLERTVDTPERNRLMVEKYRELGRGQPAIAFTVDIAHSHDLASEFRRVGIVAEPISGNTSEHERRRIFAGFRDGEIAVLISCGVLTVGFDAPNATVALMGRPTRSGLLYRQMCGRVLRPYPAPEDGPPIKKEAIIIDFSDLCLKHRIITAATLFGLHADFDLKGARGNEAIKEIEESQQKYAQLSLGAFRDLQTLRSIVERIDLFKLPSIPDAVRAYSKFAWLESSSESYRLGIPQGLVLTIRPNALGRFEVSSLKDGHKTVVYDNVDTITTAFSLADGLVPQQVRRVLYSDAGWRSDPPSSRQIQALAKLDRDMFNRFGRDITKFEEYIRASFTKGEISSMITERMSK